MCQKSKLETKSSKSLWLFFFTWFFSHFHGTIDGTKFTIELLFKVEINAHIRMDSCESLSPIYIYCMRKKKSGFSVTLNLSNFFASKKVLWNKVFAQSLLSFGFSYCFHFNCFWKSDAKWRGSHCCYSLFWTGISSLFGFCGITL